MAFCGGLNSLSVSEFLAKGELSVVSYEDTYVLLDTLSVQEAIITYNGTKELASDIYVKEENSSEGKLEGKSYKADGAHTSTYVK